MLPYPIQEAIVGLCDSTEYRSKHPVPNEFVRSLYIKLLGREPETGAVQGNPIHAGRNTADVIRDFLKSEEYAVQRSTHFYRRLLQRDSSEPSGHAWAIQNSEPLQNVVKGFMTSEEYRAKATSRQDTDTTALSFVALPIPVVIEWFGSWVRSLYHDLLSRPPENENAVQAQVVSLRSGRPPRDVVNQFLTSQEYCFGRSYWMYQYFLDREPEPGAREARGHQFMQGYPFQAMIAEFCESPEFKIKHPAPIEFIRFLYYKILSRQNDPEVNDPGGFQHQIAAINNGTDLVKL
jgi:hypothetical protein